MHGITRSSDLTCSNCGFTMWVAMPSNACVYFHECSHCKTLMRPKPGDCCVFCSYGSVPCPSRQGQAKPPTQAKE